MLDDFIETRALAGIATVAAPDVQVVAAVETVHVTAVSAALTLNVKIRVAPPPGALATRIDKPDAVHDGITVSMFVSVMSGALMPWTAP